MEAGEPFDLNQFLDAQEQNETAAAFAKTGFQTLSGAHQLLGGKLDYDRLRLYRAVQGQGVGRSRRFKLLAAKSLFGLAFLAPLAAKFRDLLACLIQIQESDSIKR